MAERNGIVPDANVACDYRDENGSIAQGFRSRQMDGIQGPDRFDREGACGVSENFFCDTDYVTTPCKPLQRENRGALLLSRDPSREAGAKQGASSFGHRQRRRDTLPLGTN